MAAVLPAESESTCRHVQGHFEETLVTSGCTSIACLCTVAQLFGNLKGEARFTATSFIPSVDTQTTAVIFATGDTEVVDAPARRQAGHAAHQERSGVPHDPGDLTDVQSISGGTEISPRLPVRFEPPGPSWRPVGAPASRAPSACRRSAGFSCANAGKAA
jgi:hypothetical protein